MVKVGDKEPYQYAMDILSSISEYKDPFLKVDALLLMRYAIHYCIDKYYDNQKKILL